MRRLLTLVLALALVLGLSSAAAAAFSADLGVGARALAMGGAYVAVADDGTAAYWNPAGITQIKIVSITPALTLNGDLMDMRLGVGDEFPPNLGDTELQVKGMLGATFHGIGISLIGDVLMETSYEDYGTYQESGGLISVAGTGMVTLAHEFGNILSVGANLKGMYGKSAIFGASTATYSGDMIEAIGTGYAVDFGAMLRVGKLLRIGAVVENAVGTMNWESTSYTYNPGNPLDPQDDKWDLDQTDSYPEEIPAFLHIGMAVKPPLIGTMISVQADKLLEDDGFSTYRVGLEQSLLILKLRAGAMLDSEFEPLVYTAGVGLKLGPVLVDVAAQTDPEMAFEAVALTAGFSF